MKIVGLLVVLLCLCGCALNAYQNKPLKGLDPPPETKAAFKIKTDRGSHQHALGILALSGGGSRAAYWSAGIMLAMEDLFSDEGLNLLSEIDVISSVSGGSLPAAYYAISYSSDDSPQKAVSGRKWDRKTVEKLMRRNYKARWFGNWFWPTNIIKYWFTAFDRSDIMAQTLADNLYDKKRGGGDLKFKDINPERPNIVLNATNGTRGRFAETFTFTNSSFRELKSDLSRYEIANAVMATASFPAVFNYMTLRDYRRWSDGERRYVHVFDGGNADNMGLDSVKRILAENAAEYEKIFIILVDAFTMSKGVSGKDYDSRKAFDYAVDLNFLDSVDSLLAKNRQRTLEAFVESLADYADKQIVFYHIGFDVIRKASLRAEVHDIKTDFALPASAGVAIESAVDLVIVNDNECLKKIRNLIVEQNPGPSDHNCKCPGST